jgi:Mg-chelatase subunit ChlI
MPNYVLIHGNFHEIPDDTLMHWKYIKREKVNGKWKYYYSMDELKKDAKSAITNIAQLKTKSIVKTADDAQKVASVGKNVINKLTGTTKSNNVDLNTDSRLIYDKRGTAADIAKTNARSKSTSSNSSKIDLSRDSRLIYDKRGSSSNVSEEAKTKAVNHVVSKVIKGDYGNGSQRVKELEKIGHDYASVQNLVNERLLKNKR